MQIDDRLIFELFLKLWLIISFWDSYFVQWEFFWGDIVSLQDSAWAVVFVGFNGQKNIGACRVDIYPTLLSAHISMLEDAYIPWLGPFLEFWHV